MKEPANNEDELIAGDVLEEEFLDDIQSENLQPSFSSLNDFQAPPGHKSRTFQILDKHQLSVISSRSEEESEDESHKLSKKKKKKKYLIFFIKKKNR